MYRHDEQFDLFDRLITIPLTPWEIDRQTILKWDPAEIVALDRHAAQTTPTTQINVPEHQDLTVLLHLPLDDIPPILRTSAILTQPCRSQILTQDDWGRVDVEFHLPAYSRLYGAHYRAMLRLGATLAFRASWLLAPDTPS